jgi:Glycosyltransferase 61
MIKVVSKRSSGSLFHYAHFFQDCLFPEFCMGLQEYRTVVRQKSLGQSIGKFKAIYEEIMGTHVLEVEESDFNDQVIEVHTINKPSYEQFESFRQHIFALYNIIHNPIQDSDPVVLIRRGKRIELLDDPDLMKQNLVLYSATTGAERREIRQLDKVEAFLQEVYGNDKVCTVELEKMSFSDQVRLFSRAQLVIGIHGAGLANMVFCRPGTTLVEVDPEWPFDWQFVNHFCSTYGVRRICCPNSLDAIQDCIRKIS